jgi:hypothetical protein
MPTPSDPLGMYDGRQAPTPEPQSPIVGIDPVELKNYVSNEKVRKDIQDLLPIVKRARENRRSKVENDWERYRDVYNLRRTQSFYEGRSKLFLGVLRDAVDTLTRIAKDSILSDPYISVETDVDDFKDVAIEFYSRLLEDQAKIRSKVSMFLRQLYTIGTSCMRFGWKEVTRTVKYREKDEEGNLQIRKRKQYECYGPSLEVVDMAHVYVWPETATDYETLRMVWEDGVTTFDKLRVKAAKGWYSKEAVDEAISIRQTSVEELKRSTSQKSKESGTDELADDELDISDLWVRYRLPDAEKDEDEAWVWVTYSGEKILRIQENPWWFGLPPYLFGAIFREHDYFYGHGVIEAGEMWQYMVNDLVNQTMDAGNYSLNAITIMDPDKVDDPDMYQIEPMAKWLIAPDAVKFERPPAQMTMEGLNMVRFIVGIIQDQSKANALVSGTPQQGMGRSVSTATGVSQLSAAANSAVIDQVEELEAQVFTPMLKMVEIAAHQFMEEGMIIRQMGPDGAVLTQRIIEPQDLVLASDIRWIASMRLREKMSKSQQMLNLLNLTIGMDPRLAQSQGFRINYKDLLIDTASGIGVDNASKYVEDITTSLPGIAPELEEELTAAGRRVEAASGETMEFHLAHIEAHMALPMPNSPLARMRKMELIHSHQAKLQELQQIEAAKAQEAIQAAPTSPGTPGGVGRGPVGGDMPVRPQEMPAGNTEGELMAGINSLLGGNTGQ